MERAAAVILTPGFKSRPRLPNYPNALTGIQVVVRLLNLFVRGRNSLMRRTLPCMVLATLVGIAGGCVTKDGVTHRTDFPQPIKPIAQDATLEDLVVKYNATAAGVKSLNAIVELKPTAGSKYTGF